MKNSQELEEVKALLIKAWEDYKEWYDECEEAEIQNEIEGINQKL